MVIYYKRVVTFHKYPFQTEIDEKFVEYSKSRKRFRPFVRSEVSLTMEERKTFVGNHLGIDPGKFRFEKVK